MNPRTPQRKADIEAARLEYLNGYDNEGGVGRIYPSLNSLAMKYKIPAGTLRDECTEGQWTRQRETSRIKALTRQRERRAYDVAKLEAVFNDRAMQIVDAEMAVLRRVAFEHVRAIGLTQEQEQVMGAPARLADLSPEMQKEVTLVVNALRELSHVKHNLLGTPPRAPVEIAEVEEEAQDDSVDELVNGPRRVELIDIYKRQLALSAEQASWPLLAEEDDD